MTLGIGTGICVILVVWAVAIEPSPIVAAITEAPTNFLAQDAKDLSLKLKRGAISISPSRKL